MWIRLFREMAHSTHIVKSFHKQSFMGIKVSALIETLLFVFVFLILDKVFMTGDRLYQVSLHPFWIIIILTSVHYGVNAGLLSASICTLCLLIGNIPEQSVDQDYYEYGLSIAYRPLLWFFSALVLGELREKHIHKTDNLTKNLEDKTEQLEKITLAYERVEFDKQRLQTQLAGQLNTAISLYETAKSMERLSTAKVLLSALKLVENITSADELSIFLLTNSRLQASVHHGWSANSTYQTSFDSDCELFKSIIGTQKILKISDQEDQLILGQQGILAGAIINREEGVILGMLKIESLPFYKLNLTIIKSFEFLCDWIGAVLSNAQSYRKNQLSIQLDGESFLPKEIYSHYIEFLKNFGKRMSFDISSIEIKIHNPHEMTEKNISETAETLHSIVSKNLRKTDLAYRIDKRGWEYLIILPATSLANASIALNKIKQAVNTLQTNTLSMSEFSIQIKEIYSANNGAGSQEENRH